MALERGHKHSSEVGVGERVKQIQDFKPGGRCSCTCEIKSHGRVVSNYVFNLRHVCNVTVLRN